MRIFLIALLCLNLTFAAPVAQAGPIKQTCADLVEFGKSLKNPVGFIKDHWLNFTPFALLPISAVTGGDLGAAFAAGSQISGSIFVLDASLDLVIDNAKEVVPPAFIIALIAGTSNIPEAGASQASALFAQDHIADVGSVPAGSNHTNLALAPAAVIMAAQTRAESEGWLKKGQSILKNPKAFHKVLKKVLYNKDVIQQLGIGGLFAVSAIMFQSIVRPQMHEGDFTLLAPWIAVNSAAVAVYMKKTTFNKKAQWASAVDLANEDHINNVVGKLADQKAALAVVDGLQENPRSAEDAGITPQQLDRLERAFKNIQAFQKEEGKADELLAKAQEDLAEIKNDISDNPAIEEWLYEIVDDEDSKDVFILLNMAGITNSQGHMTKREKVETMMLLLGGAAGVAAISPVLDMGVENMAKALPGMDKSMAGFFLMSIISSLPELFTMKKLFGEASDRSGAQVVADSNALNISLVMMAMFSSWMIMLF